MKVHIMKITWCKGKVPTCSATYRPYVNILQFKLSSENQLIRIVSSVSTKALNANIYCCFYSCIQFLYLSTLLNKRRVSLWEEENYHLGFLSNKNPKVYNFIYSFENFTDLLQELYPVYKSSMDGSETTYLEIYFQFGWRGGATYPTAGLLSNTILPNYWILTNSHKKCPQGGKGIPCWVGFGVIRAFAAACRYHIRYLIFVSSCFAGSLKTRMNKKLQSWGLQ